MLRESTGASLSAAERAVEQAWLTPLRTALGAELLERERASGRMLNLDEAVAVALGATHPA